MTRNTQVAADHSAPALTHILAYLLGTSRTTDLIEACWGFGRAKDVRALTALTRP